MNKDTTILKLQDHVRRLTNQIAQVKEAMREPPCFEGSLNLNHS